MDGGKIGVFEEADYVGLGCLLEGQDGGSLEAQIMVEIGVKVLGNLAHKALEGQLADQKLRGLLVPADLTQGDRARSPSVRRTVCRLANITITPPTGRGLRRGPARGLSGELSWRHRVL